MTASDAQDVGEASNIKLRLAGSIHLRGEADGGALVVDDRTLTAARINRSAYVLFQTLAQPRTPLELAGVLAEASGCSLGEALAPVETLILEAGKLGWIVVEGGGSEGTVQSDR